MFGFLHRLFQGLWPETKIIPIVPIDEDWIPIFLETEEKLTEDYKSRLSLELDMLRKRNSSTARTVIFNRAVEALKDIVIPDISLTPDLKNRIFRDILMKVSPEWLAELQFIAPGIQSQWFSSSYEKNTLGQLIDLTDRVAPDKLTPSGIAQTLRGIHLGLIQAIALHRGVPLSEHEIDQVLQLLANTLIQPLITLWIATTKQVSPSLTKQGQLPLKWSNEQDVLTQKLQRIKAEGASARYTDGDLDPVRKAYLEKTTNQLLDSNEFLKRQASLKKINNLKEKVPIESEINPDDFRRAKTSLGLFFRRR